MAWADDIAAVNEDFYSLAGQSAQYTPPEWGAAPVSCSVIRGVATGEGGRGADDFGATDVWQVRSSEISLPAATGTFELADGAVWEVLSASLASAAGVWNVTVNKVETDEAERLARRES